MVTHNSIGTGSIVAVPKSRAVSMAGSGFACFGPALDLPESNRRTEHLDPRNERSSMRR